MTEPDTTTRLRPDPDLSPVMGQGGAASPARAGLLLALGWLAGIGAGGAAAFYSGLAASPAAAASMALAVTAPVALGIGYGALAARITAAEDRVALRLRAAMRQDEAPDLPRIGRMAADAVRATLAAERAKTAEAQDEAIEKLTALSQAQARIEAQLDTLASLTATAQTAARVQAAEARRKERPTAAFMEAPAARIVPSATARIVPPPAALRPESKPEPKPAPKPESAPAPEPAAQTPAPDDGQQDLPLPGATPADAATRDRDWSLIARALNFPRDADDAEGFAALAEAVKDPLVSDLLQAAEDTLTLLAQHNVYMEDLTVRPASPEHWAAFITGVRGPAVAAVSGVQEAEAIDTVRALNRHDAIFRDTAMHLMRRYDAMIRKALEAPSGAHRLPELADTRTGRAYMLAARAVGAFD